MIKWWWSYRAREREREREREKERERDDRRYQFFLLLFIYHHGHNPLKSIIWHRPFLRRFCIDCIDDILEDVHNMMSEHLVLIPIHMGVSGIHPIWMSCTKIG